jgi:hypothetical protein
VQAGANAKTVQCRPRSEPFHRPVSNRSAKNAGKPASRTQRAAAGPSPRSQLAPTALDFESAPPSEGAASPPWGQRMQAQQSPPSQLESGLRSADAREAAFALLSPLAKQMAAQCLGRLYGGGTAV